MFQWHLVGEHMQGGARVGLWLFMWKRIRNLINNRTRINSVFCILTTVNLLLPHPLYKKIKTEFFLF